MELHFNEATATLSVFEESLEYLISLNGKEICFFSLSRVILPSVVEQKTLNENILAECYFQHCRHYTAEKLVSQ